MSQKLRTGRHEFTQYRENLFSKGAGKPPRAISVPTVRDRIALRALADYMLEVHPAAKGKIPQISVLEVQNLLQANYYDTFIRLDVENFYPSIAHDLVIERLTSVSVDARLPPLVRNAIMTPTVADGAPKKSLEEFNTEGVPQGLAISNIASELAISSVDEEMAKRQDCAYVRFVDDILILCDGSDAVEVATRCSELFDAIGLTVHQLGERSKSYSGPVSSGFDFLGYIFKQDKTSVRESSVRRIESRLASSFSRYKRAAGRSGGNDPRDLARCKWYVDLAVTGCVYGGAARGWLQYFRQMDDLTLLKRLDITVDRLSRRYGLPSEFSPKSFMKAYWPIKFSMKNENRYIPYFDEYTPDQMRDHLALLTSLDVDDMSVFQLEIAFRRNIEKAVSDLERDVGFLS